MTPFYTMNEGDEIRGNAVLELIDYTPGQIIQMPLASNIIVKELLYNKNKYI